MLVLQLVAPITPEGRLREVDEHPLSWPIGMRATFWKKTDGGRWYKQQWNISIGALNGRKIAGFRGRTWSGWVGEWDTTPCGRVIIIRLGTRTIAIRRKSFKMINTNITQKCLRDSEDADYWTIVDHARVECLDQ